MKTPTYESKQQDGTAKIARQMDPHTNVTKQRNTSTSAIRSRAPRTPLHVHAVEVILENLRGHGRRHAELHRRRCVRASCGHLLFPDKPHGRTGSSKQNHVGGGSIAEADQIGSRRTRLLKNA